MRMTLLLRYIICPLVGPRTIGGVPSEGGLSKGFYPVITRVSENTTENSEQLGRQARPGFEPGTSRLPVLSVTTLPLVEREHGGKEDMPLPSRPWGPPF